MIQEVFDIIEEHPVEIPIDHTETVEKLQILRRNIRLNEIKLETETPDEHLTKRILQAVEAVRLYSQKFEEQKANQQKPSIAIQPSSNDDSILFTIDDIHRCIDELTAEFNRVPKQLTNEELIQLKSNLSSNFTQINDISKRIESIISKESSNPEIQEGFKILRESYRKLTALKTSYIQQLNNEAEERQVYKQKLFSESNLNIELEKFSGHNDSIDYYTFKSKFEMLHEKRTPKNLLPELLKNNYLKEPALSAVKTIDNIDEIWKKLKFAYGDVMVILQTKISRLSTMSPLYRSKDVDSTINALHKLANLVKELTSLVKTHNIENYLYYGGAKQNILRLLGDARLSRWLTQADDSLSPEETWTNLTKFLENEIKLQQQKSIVIGQSSQDSDSRSIKSSKRPLGSSQDSRTTRNQRYGYSSTSSTNAIPSDPICYICNAREGTDDHVATLGPGGTRIIQYFSCKKFAELSPSDRLALLKDKGYCFQCLFPGADASSLKHKEGRCQHDYVCRHPYHQKYPTRKHVLVCNRHKDHDANKDILRRFKQRFVKSPDLPDFARNISLSFHAHECYKTNPQPLDNSVTVPEEERGIYLLQTVLIKEVPYTIFFDSGCSDFIVKQSAVTSLGSNAIQISSDVTQIGGVGNMSLQSFGTFNVNIPQHHGQPASLTGISLESITTTFPQYPLLKPFQDISDHFKSTGGNPKQLPRPDKSVGGDIHFMIGIRYLRYFPRLVHQLPSGLSIYESVFNNIDGSRGVIGGPHSVFTKIHQTFFNQSSYLGFMSQQYELFKMGIQVNPDIQMLSSNRITTRIKEFEDVENAGSVITYRCIKCRACKDCKNSPHQEEISIKEEVEQHLIDSSITVDLNNKQIIARLPFIDDPSKKLAPNKSIALKIYNQQIKKLDKNPVDKAEIIASESKLQQLGFVDYVDDLTLNQQEILRNSPSQNFIPWRAVWKTTSVSTPCRVVFDASHPTSTGFSLNDILAKGKNNLNKLQEILIRFSTHHVGIHSDIRKMYNTIKLDENHWCYQRYVWQEDLDPRKQPREKVIKTLIYGVRSSGNQAEHGLRTISNIFKDQFPEVNQIIQNDIYVDDCITGEDNINLAHQRADELERVITHGDFHLKGVTFSGSDPPENLTEDGTSIMVGGMIWHPKSDELSINIGELNFSKKRRGKKSPEAVNIIPEKLTKRHCASKIAEIFDLTGKIAPVVASMKLDLHELSTRQLSWDDTIPDELRPIWTDHFDTMKTIKDIRFKRAIVPSDATSLDITTLNFGDASQSLICAAIYARFHRKTGEFSSQLVFARTKIVPKNLTLPRAELFAAVTNVHTGEVVKRSFKQHFKSSMQFTDSQITLHWISNDEKPLKHWVRNRVLEIQRFTAKDQWFYIQSNQMIADLGTRRGATFNDVNQDSEWINGLEWMHKPVNDFPTQSAEELKLTESSLIEVKKEQNIVKIHFSSLSKEMADRYKFSKYVIDPNRHQFSQVVRVVAYVLKFARALINRLKKIKAPPSESLTNQDIVEAESYFFQKGTLEVKRFLPKSKYHTITKEVNGILLYTGRILPEDNVSIVGRFTHNIKDLTSMSFCVPVLDRKSPIAYAIALDVHWNHPTVNHSGVETTLRYVESIAHIIEGRKLVKYIKKSCHRCRFLAKRTVDIAMGPTSEYNITIAPAFYFTQVDLSGPYSSYSSHNKRATVKIWLVVFCCCSTSATSIKIMDTYSTPSFVMAFTRFSCNHGYPKKLLCDEGSQLVKACKEMKLNFLDIKSQLHNHNRVEFELCPVQGHSMHGKVERKIREINLSIEKSAANHRLSMIQWETLSSSISNQINNLPIAIGDVVGDLECLDLITPNRLLLGRNNDRCPDGIVYCDNPTKILKENEDIYNSWFEVWLLVHVPKLMKQQKWYQTDEIKVGDVVIFTKNDSVLSKSYTYGIVKDLDYGKDGKPRKALVRYRNSNEEVFRETFRAVRSLVIIHGVDECDLLTEIGEMALICDLVSK